MIGDMVYRDQLGFSVIELVTALSLAAILMAVASPSMRAIKLENQLSASANRFFTSITLARNTAISANSEVIICQSNSQGSNCNERGSWQDGWLVWSDFDNDDLVESINQDGQQEIILHQQALPADIYIQLENNHYTHRIVFNPLGEAHNALRHVTQAFHLCDSNLDSPSSRDIVYLNGSGQAWQQKDKLSSLCRPVN